jgi:ZIP family zinc transporter
LINYLQLLLLGSIAGFTIFLGLPLARLQNVSPKKKGFLNAIAIGILIFLIIDVFGHAWDSVGDVAQDTFSGKVSVGTGVPTILALFGGLAIGTFGTSILREQIHEEKAHSTKARKRWRR